MCTTSYTPAASTCIHTLFLRDASPRTALKPKPPTIVDKPTLQPDSFRLACVDSNSPVQAPAGLWRVRSAQSKHGGNAISGQLQRVVVRPARDVSGNQVPVKRLWVFGHAAWCVCARLPGQGGVYISIEAIGRSWQQLATRMCRG